jgi:DNA (cytosine-5)-methyltransferase 1
MEENQEVEYIKRKEKNRGTAISLFTGVGGFDFGVHRYFNVVAACEIDPKISKTYSQNFSGVPVFGDIRYLTGGHFPGVAKGIDLVFGGSPCQGFSPAGNSDNGDLLIFDYQRIVLDIRPKYFIFENVSELFNGRNKVILEQFLNGFTDNGYSIVTPIKVLDCSDYGVPQTRKRVFILGYRDDQLSPEYPPVLLDKKVVLSDVLEYLPNASDYPVLYNRDWENVIEYGIITASKLTRHDVATLNLFKSYPQGHRETSGRRIKPFWDKPCPTIITKQRIIHPLYNRYLTVRECSRIQTFPDWYIFSPDIQQGQKEVGNSVPPSMAQYLAKCIYDVL